MAGFMDALQGYVYEGELVNGEATALTNGMIVAPKLVSGKLVFALPAADADTKLLCKEVGTIYDGITAYRFIVNTVGKPAYFVENGFDNGANAEYDNTLYEIKPGKFVRAHRLVVGDEFWTTEVTGTPAVGSEYGVLATGKIG